MAEEMRRRTELRAALSDQLGGTVTDMLLDYMPSADWADNIDRRFDLVDRQFMLIDQRLDRMDERLDRMDERFNQMDERFDRMDKQFVRMETSIGLIRESQGTWVRWMITMTVTAIFASVGAVAALVQTLN